MWIEWQVCGYRYGAGNKWKTNHLFQWILSRSNDVDVEHSLVCQYFFSMQKTKNKTIDIQPHLFENETEIFLKLIFDEKKRLQENRCSTNVLLKITKEIKWASKPSNELKMNHWWSLQMNWMNWNNIVIAKTNINELKL